ncbi:hypothetical protein, partial [Pseudomonas corrugata]|uniref:hypothetical protein n=1 Tax=Pseudomonas corrugata TaxID=47879 RepID=UPI001F525B6E
GKLRGHDSPFTTGHRGSKACPRQRHHSQHHPDSQQAKKTGATEVAPVVVPVAVRIFVGPLSHR